MKSIAQKKAETAAVKRLREQHQLPQADELVNRILAQDRTALSQAITLAESSSVEHAALALEIIKKCLPHSGRSFRIGITGVPGVGKSTFIESFGTHLTSIGKHVAVLAVDPSSPLSGGSILGDKTRMEKLSLDANAFIRPSPTSQSLGGVTKSTRQNIALCEAAGFDIIIVETVGVGQSETAVHGMTDFFLLLMLAGAGDQLQGIKRGIMEMADGIIITKADGDNEKNAAKAKAEYFSALHLYPPKPSGWQPKVEVTSALYNKGVAETWKLVCDHKQWMKERGFFEVHRKAQELEWVREAVSNEVVQRFFSRQEVADELKRAQKELASGKLSGFEAIQSLYRFI